MRSSVPPPPLPAHAQQGSVASTVRALAAGARPSDVWRSAAFALLRLNPKECEALGLVFEEAVVADEVRVLVLDLLAGAGSFEAQVVIRRLLSLAVARRDSRLFSTFVQRLAIVEAPDGPTLRFLMSVYAESRGEPADVRAACAYALGAAAGQALASGDGDAAVRASDVLRRDLAAATTVVDTCALLTALGNAGLTSDVTAVTRFTQDAEATVRCAAALALRKLNIVDARAHLLLLLGDREPKVANSALAALSEHKLDDEELERLADQVNAGHTPASLDVRILHLIVAQRPRLTSVPGRAGAIENALRLLLGRVEAAGSNDPLAGSGERRVFAPPTKFPSVSSAAAAAPAMISEKAETPIPQPMPIPQAIPVPQPVASPQAIAIPPPPMPMSATPPQAAATLPQAPYVSPIAATLLQRFDPTATVVDAMPLGVEVLRARMIQMGLDPNAPVTIIPQPPQRRPEPAPAPPAEAAPTRAKTRLSPNAIVRGR